MSPELFEYKARQSRCYKRMVVSSILIIQANQISYRSHDTDYPYRANSNVLYFTGFEEPGCTLILLKNKKSECKTILFVQPKDPVRETRTGPRIGPELTKENYSVIESYPNTELEKWFQKNTVEIFTMYYNIGGVNKKLEELVINKFAKSQALLNPVSLLAGLRTVKDDKEIESMKKSAEIAVQAHILAMKSISPNIMEYEIQDIVNHFFKSQGASGPAYNSICASGDNANILHYVRNNDKCKDGDLFLLDAGCEYRYYASDITRTFPVNGKFTDVQKKIYSIVLNANKIAIEHCIVGKTWDEINDVTIKIITRGLVNLGVLNGDVGIDKLIEEKKYKPYYIHTFGHSLGLDTHDISNFETIENGKLISTKIQAGTVLTVEPGLYFSSILKDIPEELKGIGIRIEDDILFTNEGPVNLTTSVPKEIEEIEALMKKN